MSFALRVDDDAPRYFRHRTLGGACETSFECTGVTLLSAREGAKRVTVRARCDSGPSFVIARLIPDVHESVSFVHVFEGEDARFSARGGSVELRGTTEHEIRAVDSSDDEGCDSDESWGSDVEASREVAETAGGNEDARARETAARLEAARTGKWRTLDEVRKTMDWWDGDKNDFAFHVQSAGAKRSSRSGKMPTFAWTGKLRPRKTTAKRSYPSGLNPPDYASSGWPEEEFGSRFQSTVEVKPHEARQAMRAACSLARHVMDTVAWALEPGVTTEELDRICHAVTVGNGAYPSPLNYMGFPKSLCTSVNEVVCHGIPDARPLEDGDIVNLDITVHLNGYHGDLNETYYVGKGGAKSKAAQKLMDCTRKALEKAIAYCRPGRRFRDLGEIIAEEASRGGYASVKDFCGHGIGQLFHCAPNVPHYARNKAIGVMKEGMTFTIEPMFNESSSHKVVHWPDGWTAVTTNGARSAQYEHTLLITSDGVEVLTARNKNSRPFVA